jgi:integrative and conjugative element protein (TIGR02256 family)
VYYGCGYSVIISITFIELAENRETGGVLAGYYSQLLDRAIIKNLTGPPKDSKRGYTWFVRGVSGLQSLIFQLWKKKQYYLGEWHFHPHASSHPSSQDINQMAMIAESKQYHCPEPLLLIIGGSPENFEIRIFVIFFNKRVIELVKKEK